MRAQMNELLLKKIVSTQFRQDCDDRIPSIAEWPNRVAEPSIGSALIGMQKLWRRVTLLSFIWASCPIYQIEDNYPFYHSEKYVQDTIMEFSDNAINIRCYIALP